MVLKAILMIAVTLLIDGLILGGAFWLEAQYEARGDKHEYHKR